MKRELVRIKNMNILTLFLVGVLVGIYIGVTPAVTRYIKIEAYIVLAVILIFAFVVNIHRNSYGKIISRTSSACIIFMGIICCWVSCSPIILVVMLFFAGGMVYYNGIEKAFIEHLFLTYLSEVFFYAYPFVAKAFNLWIHPNYRTLHLQEMIGTLVIITVADMFFISLLRRMNSVKTIVDEQELTTQELLKIVEAKADDARNATKSKSEFLASMSHEIRTPLNSVLGMNEMILRETKEEFTREYAQDIQRSGNMLLGLINNILDFSKIESGKMQIVPIVYDLSSMLNDLVVMTTTRAASKSIAVKLEIDGNVPRVLKGDEVRIKQILNNILSNAVKYTDSGSVTICVDYQKKDERSIILEVSVTDTGHGMKQEDFDKLFSPFERIEELRNRHVEGTGLGMSITRQLLALMDSELEVKSTYGVGSTFGFKIRQEVDNWEPLGNFEEAIKKFRRGKEKNNNGLFTAPDAKVLVVDDLQLNLNVFVKLLKRTQVQVDTALSGKDALEMARLKKYDIIFMDHMMPEMDGIETLSKIRKDRFSLCRMTQVVALTANAVSGAREFYIEKGFVDYISKPVNPNSLEAMVEKYLPEELVEVGETYFEEVVEASSTANESNSIIDEIRKIQQLDVDEGISYTGDEENYVQMVEEFFKTIPTRRGMIKEYWENSDIKNYTIQVHALKSTARLIGATELSEFAKSMEEAGHAENIEKINDFTGELLDQYEEIRVILGNVFKEKNTEGLELITQEALEQAILDIKDGFENFDFDKMEGTVKKLEEYRMPEEFEADFEKLKSYVSDVAIEEIGIWLEEREK